MEKKRRCGKPGCLVCGEGGILESIEMLNALSRSIPGKDFFSGDFSSFPGGPGPFEKIASMIERKGSQLNMSDIVAALDDGDISKIMRLTSESPFFSEADFRPGRKPRSMADLFSGFPGNFSSEDGNVPRVFSVSSKEEMSAALKKIMSGSDPEIDAAIEELFDEGAKTNEEDVLANLPEEIRGDCTQFNKIWNGKKYLFLEEDGPVAVQQLCLVKSLQFKKRAGSDDLLAQLGVSGVYAKAILKIGNDEVAILIPKAFDLSEEIKEMSSNQRELRVIFSNLKKTIGNLEEQLSYQLHVGWPELYTGNNVLVIQKNETATAEQVQKGEEPKFVLLLNDEIQTETRLDDNFGQRLFDLQENIASQTKAAEEARIKFRENSILLDNKKSSRRKAMRLIGEHFKKNPIKNCKPFAMALDVENDNTPCILVETRVDLELAEIPSDMKRHAVEAHLSGDIPMDEKMQKALGVKSKIDKIEKSKASIKKNMDNL